MYSLLHHFKPPPMQSEKAVTSISQGLKVSRVKYLTPSVRVMGCGQCLMPHPDSHTKQNILYF